MAENSIIQPSLSSFPAPASWGLGFTPTHHTSVYPTIDPSKTRLSKPFVAVVIGAGKGIGSHIALAFARAGATGISISSRTQKDLDAVEEEIENINPDIEVLKTIVDTRSSDAVQDLEKQVRETFGRVDAVIANAGVLSKYVPDDTGGLTAEGKELKHRLPIGILEDDDWDRVFDINLFGSWRVAKMFLPLLKETSDGAKTLILMSSIAAHNTSSIFAPTAYNVSKLAINRLVEHIHEDHGPGKDGIQVFAVHPGAVLTPMTEANTGEVWQNLSDDVDLCGAWCVWSCQERREWLSGRYVKVNWDVSELEGRKEEIMKKDLLKARMTV